VHNEQLTSTCTGAAGKRQQKIQQEQNKQTNSSRRRRTAEAEQVSQHFWKVKTAHEHLHEKV
jgi:hypothetical protein